MSVIKYFQFIIQISLVNILKLFLILRKFSALYSYKGYSYRKKKLVIPQHCMREKFWMGVKIPGESFGPGFKFGRKTF